MVLTVTRVDAVCPLPPVAVAVTVQEPAVAGALNRPVLSIVPQVADHVAAALAVKLIVPLGATVGVKGDIVRVDVPVPNPVSPTTCGLLLAPSVNITLALREPAAVGLNAIVAEQLAPAAKLAPHVLLEIKKSAAFAPPTAMLLIAIEAEPVFVRVIGFGPPVCPTATLTQFKLAGLTVADPEVPLVPVPDRATDCGLLLALSPNWRVADLAPAALGLKLIVAVQLAPDARVAPHVLLERTKSAEFVPVTETPLMEIDAALPF